MDRRLQAAKFNPQLLHPPIDRQGVTQGFEQPDFGTKLMIDGHAGDIGLAGNGVDGESSKAFN